MKKRFYLNGRYHFYSIFLFICLLLQILILGVLNSLNLIFELWYIFVFQILAILFYSILGISQRFIIKSDRIEHWKFFKKNTYSFVENRFVCKMGNTDMKNHGLFFGIQFLPSHSEFWIKPKTNERQLVIMNSKHFEMFTMRKNFRIFYQTLSETMVQNNSETNLEKLNFDK